MFRRALTFALMLYAFVFTFGLLWAVNLCLEKNHMYPPALMSGVWFVSLCALALSGDTFFEMAPGALMVFLAGAMAFSVGGLLTLALTRREQRATSPSRDARATLDLCLVVLCVSLPFFARYMIGDIDTGSIVSTLHGIRMRSVAEADASERGLSLFANLIVLSGFIVIAMQIENDGTLVRRRRLYLAFAVALAYGVLTGSKGVALIVLTLMFISVLRSGRTSFISMAKFMGVFVGLFAAGLLIINFAYAEMDAYETIGQVSLGIQNYWLSSLVAFGSLYAHPHELASVHNPARAFMEFANGFGARYKIPSIHAAYVDVGPDQNTNTYTIYFSYFTDFGWLGAVAAMGAFGAVSTWTYLKARRGPIALAFAAAFAVASIFTVHSDKFILGLNQHVKMLLFFWFVYSISPALWRAWREFWRLGLTH